MIFIIWYFQNNITQMITAPTFRNSLLGLCINISIPSIDVSFDPVWFSSPSNRKLPCTIASFPLPTTSKNRRRRRFGAIPLFVPYRSNIIPRPYPTVEEKWWEWARSEESDYWVGLTKKISICFFCIQLLCIHCYTFQKIKIFKQLLFFSNIFTCSLLQNMWL